MKKPPRFAAWMLRSIANRDERAAIVGDCEEEFHEHSLNRGTLRAHLWYWSLVLVSLPSFLRHIASWSVTMFKNHLTIAQRIIRRHKGFSFINIAGLSVGLSAALIIALYVRHEMSFDRHHENLNRIFRVCVSLGEQDNWRGAFTVPPMAAAMKDEFPEVEETVRMSPWPRNYLIRTGEKAFLEKGLIFADGSIFRVFTLPVILGDPEAALTQPFTVVLTHQTAQKYFGNENPLGRILRFEDGGREYQVTAVVEDCPPSSHFQYNMIASLNSLASSRETSWGGHSYFTYLLLNEGIDAARLEAKFPDFVRRYWGAYTEAQTGMRFEELIQQDQFRYGYFLEPLKDLHLNPSGAVTDQLSIKGNRSTLFMFSTIAAIILLVACINFMNLSTARFAHRCKEVGVRKVLGSNRRQLVSQFLGESGLLGFLALGIALAFTSVILPSFGHLTQRRLSLTVLQEPSTWLFLLALTALVGIIAGSYPAVFLSSFPPLRALRAGRSGSPHRHILLRRGLVVFQYIVTFSIIFGTLVMASQLRFLRHRDLGFDQEQVLVIHRASALRAQKDAFKQELLQYPDIFTISDTDTLPGRHYDPNSHRLEGRPGNEEKSIFTMYADSQLLELLGLSLIEGRNFSPEIPTDWTSAVIINETTAREWGLQDPVGKRFYKEFGTYQAGDFVTIIGVIRDFHFHSLHHSIEPMIIRPLSSRDWAFTSIKLRSRDLPATLARVEAAWTRFTGGQPFEYSFLDEDFNSLYQNEQRTGTIFGVFAGVAVAIACLGLFGLISFSAERRIKEIGIRKVLGARTSGIMVLLSREILILVAAAVGFASPLAFYFMHRWLERFAFRITIHPVMFLATASITIGIAFLTIGYRALKAGRANPAEALKNE
jgi:putative ABC transport system permease protein